MNDLQQLFPVTADSFGAPSVDGRKLHEWLGSKSNFTTWAKRCIESMRLIDGEDFIPILEESTGGRPGENYTFSIDAAKMIGMATKTDRGNEIRRYFLGCEKRLLARVETISLPLLPSAVARSTFDDLMAIARAVGVPESFAIFEAGELAGQQSGIDLTPLLSHAPAMDDVPKQDVLLEPTELGKLFSLDGAQMNIKLFALGLQDKVAGEWTPTDTGEALSVRHQWKSPLSGKSGYNLKWKAEEIERMMSDKGD